jgi:hypothetical protein
VDSRDPGAAAEREIMTAVAEPALTAGMLDDQLATRLLYQRIIVLGAQVDDQIANRLCARPAARSPRAWRSTTRCS